jgi:hypothetical protein
VATGDGAERRITRPLTASRCCEQSCAPRHDHALSQCTLFGTMWVTFGHLRPSVHIMPDHAGDRGTVFLVWRRTTFTSTGVGLDLTWTIRRGPLEVNARARGRDLRSRQRSTGRARRCDRGPVPGRAFDLAVAYMCLHNIDDMPHAVSEIAPSARLVRPAVRRNPHPICASTWKPLRVEWWPTAAASVLYPGAGGQWAAHRGNQGKEAARSPCGRDPAARRWQRIPFFLHLRAIKP